MRAIQPCIIEPIWEQFSALLPERMTDHPLGCHRRRIPDRVVFEKLIGVLVFGCACWRIADEECSATTLGRRRDEWIDAGAMDVLEEIVKVVGKAVLLVDHDLLAQAVSLVAVHRDKLINLGHSTGQYASCLGLDTSITCP